MKTYGGVKVELHAFFTLALDGVSGQLHAAAALLPGKDPWYPLDLGVDVRIIS